MFAALRMTALLSLRNYMVVYPPRILLLTVVPRVVLQVAFLSYLGFYAAGRNGESFAFVGAAVQIMALAIVVKGPDTLLDERAMGTLYRHRLGVVPLPLTIGVRWWVYTAEGIASAVLAVLVLAVPFGGVDLLLRLLPAIPLLVVISLGLTAFGAAVGSFALTQREDVLITNLANYALLVFCGVVAPIWTFGGAAATAVRFLPMTNGLLAVRALVAGRPFAGNLLLEFTASAAWATVALVMLHWQSIRSYRAGSDDRY